MTLLELVDKLTLQAIATAVALALSVVTFWRQEVGRRAAELVVTIEHVPQAKLSFSHTYVVIHNAGPALARQVTAQFLKGDHQPAERGARIFGDPVQIPPGHAARYHYVRSIGTSFAYVKLTWRDKRRGEQTLTAPVNIVELPGAPVVNVTVDPSSPSGPIVRGGRR